MTSVADIWPRVYAAVRRIPPGRVATYGDVAWIIEMPRGARLVGSALAALHGARHDVPWQRVLGARGLRHAGISIKDPVGAAAQRHLLEKEGIRFDERGRVPLSRFGWRKRPVSPTPRRAPASGSRSPRRTGEWSGPRRSGRSGRH